MTPDPQQQAGGRDGSTRPGLQETGQGAARLMWVDMLGRIMERWVPDVLTTAIVLMVVLVGLWLLVGGTVTQTLNAYYEGLWMFLGFTMQVTLILVLSLILTATPVFKNTVARISRAPRTRIQVVTMATLCVALISYLNWGLSLALSPV